MIDNEAVLSKSPDVVSRTIDEESIIVPIRQLPSDEPCVYTFDGVGSHIWELIDGARTLGDIIEVVVSEYEVEPGKARDDVVTFATQLVEARCAQLCVPGAGAEAS